MIAIGIDTGMNTGIAVWDIPTQKFTIITSTFIHRAMAMVTEIYERGQLKIVRIEDARLRKWIPEQETEKAERGRREGAGYVKAHAAIWEDFLKDLGIPFQLVAPKDNETKWNAETFNNVTKWKGNTNQHGRDSGFLVFGWR